MKTVFRIIFLLILVGVFSTVFFFPISNQKIENNSTKKIVTTIFPAYDFARTISEGTNTEITMLIKPGSDLHDYEPTPQDIINIKNADIFIYNGGESEAWVDNILKEVNQDNVIIVRMMDAVEIDPEQTEIDEHIWTSPQNVIKISEDIAQAFKNHTPEDSSTIQRNLDQFESELESLDKNFKKLSTQKTGTLFIADRFPFHYFVNDYGFDYFAAYPGCAEHTEPSAKTIAELTKRVKQSPQKIIFKTELSDSKIANTISKTTKAKILTWHSVHNISKSDFDSGKTYLDFMKDNLKKISEALHDRTSK